MRTPMRLLAMPRRTFFRGSLLRAKNCLSATASASGSRTSPPTTTPWSSGWRATWTSSAAPLLEMRAAASCEAPILRPTSRLTGWPPCDFGCGLGSEIFTSRNRVRGFFSFAAFAAFGTFGSFLPPSSRFQIDGFFSFGSSAAGASAGTSGAPPGAGSAVTGSGGSSGPTSQGSSVSSGSGSVVDSSICRSASSARARTWALRASRRRNEMSLCQIESERACCPPSVFRLNVISFFQIETGGCGGASSAAGSGAGADAGAGLRLNEISFFQIDSGSFCSGAAAGVAPRAASSSLRWNSSSFSRSGSTGAASTSGASGAGAAACSFGLRPNEISFFQIESLMPGSRPRAGRPRPPAAAAHSARARRARRARRDRTARGCRRGCRAGSCARTLRRR